METAVEIAAQTGRLDFLTAVLAVLAIVLGLGAFPVFFFVQRRAEAVARSEVASALAGAVDRIEAEAISKLEAMLPMLVDEYRAFAQDAARSQAPSGIATKQDGGS